MIKEIFSLEKHSKAKRTVKTWADEENEQLMSLARRFDSDWKKVSEQMVNRNPNQCAHRFRRLMRLSGRKDRWTSQEDATVVKLVEAVGKDWGAISKYITSKTNKQIRERYINKLDPKLQTRNWEDYQDRFIIDRYNQIGSRWNQIASELQGRSENMVKNRFYSHIRRYYSSSKVHSPFPCPDKNGVPSNSVRTFQHDKIEELQDPKLLQMTDIVDYIDYNILDVQSQELGYSCDSMFQI